MRAGRIKPTGWTLMTLMAAIAFVGAYRIVAHTVADGLVESDPEGALRWIGEHPEALYQLADKQRAAGELDQARRTAHRLRASAPLDGRALRLLAQVEDAEGNRGQARDLFERAAAMTPRDLPARAWLTQHYLVNEQYEQALGHIDRILRYHPRQGPVLLPVIADMAQDPAFAKSLVLDLARRPPWREALLREVQSGRHPLSAQQVLGQLQASGGLTAQEHARWIQDLMRHGHWSEAYARWAGTLPATARLPLVYNGGFEQPVTHQGFDWRVRPIPGMGVSFEPTPGAEGNAAHLVFRRRPIPEAGLEQALLLPPGPQGISLRVRVEGLRSDRGLEWQLQCANGRVLGRSPRLHGTQGWHTVTVQAYIPPECPGQWLRLRNPAPAGTGQFTEGEVWIDDVANTSGAVPSS